MLFSGAFKQSLDARGVDLGATLLPPLELRGRSHPIDIYCVPRGGSGVNVSEAPIAA
jgi:hypothetical protein